MSQTSYSVDLVVGEFGQLASGPGEDKSILSFNNLSEVIPYGRMVQHVSGTPHACELHEGVMPIGISLMDLSSENDSEYPEDSKVSVLQQGTVWVETDGDVTPDSTVYCRDSAAPEVFTITWDGDFVALNKINGSILGVAISEVTFSVDQATTIALVAAAIEALDSVLTATVTDTREITVTGANDAEQLSDSATFTVTLGVGQAADTIANVSGPSASDSLGVFRADADGSTATSYATKARFLTSASAGEAVKLEINLP